MKQQFNVTIDEHLLCEFKNKCLINGYRMNEVIEVLISSFVSGQAKFAGHKKGKR